MDEPPSRYNVTITVACQDGQLPDPVAFAAAASQAAWRRSASIVSAHTADTIISVVTVDAPGRYAAVAVARAVVSAALEHQPAAPASKQGMTAVARGLSEHPLPEPAVADLAGDLHVTHGVAWRYRVRRNHAATAAPRRAAA